MVYVPYRKHKQPFSLKSATQTLPSHYNPEIPHGALQLGMAKQSLDRPQVLGSLIDQRRLGPPHAVGPVYRRIEADGGDPLMHDPGVLTRRDVRRDRKTTGEQVVLRLHIGLFNPSSDSQPGRLGQLELHRPLRLSLDDHGSGQDLIGVNHVAHPQAHQIAAAQLAVDRQVEHGQVADLMPVLQVESNGPDILWLERWLLADQLAFVPGLVGLIGLRVRLPRN